MKLQFVMASEQINFVETIKKKYNLSAEEIFLKLLDKEISLVEEWVNRGTYIAIKKAKIHGVADIKILNKYEQIQNNILDKSIMVPRCLYEGYEEYNMDIEFSEEHKRLFEFWGAKEDNEIKEQASKLFPLLLEIEAYLQKPKNISSKKIPGAQA